MSELINAIRSGKSLEFIKKIIDAGVDVNYRDSDGDTALMLSSKSRGEEIIELVLQSGAKIDLQNNSGYTALMYACIYNNPDIIEFLVNAGADVNLKSKYGDIALIISLNYRRDFKIIELLVKNTKKLPDDILEYANNIDEIKLLLEAAANPLVRNKYMRCKSEECLREIEKVVWKKLKERDINSARKLGRESLNKDVWYLILLNNRQKSLCKNLNKSTNKYILIELALELGFSENQLKTLTKTELCSLISRSIGRNINTEKYESEKASDKTHLDKYIKSLALKYNINTEQSVTNIIKELEKYIGEN